MTPSAVDLAALWRDEWGRLLALLVAQYRRLDLAEDGLGEAFEAALRTWSAPSPPDNPTAWLLVTARRRIVDRLRREAVLARTMPLLEVDATVRQRAQRTMADAGEEVADERLRLVLLCCHPALPPDRAAALTLRLVLGVSTADIARLFLVPTATMAARLTRTRRRLAGERFVVPPPHELGARIDVAATVAYLAFTAGYAPGSGPDVLRADVAGEAVRLVRLVRDLADSPERLDPLLALMLLHHSRRDARAVDGRLVLLPDQDRTRWHQHEIDEALALLRPHVHDPPTPHLLEALVAAEHAIAPSAAATDWARIAARYAELEEVTGSAVVRLNRAVAVAEADGPLAGLALLDGVALPGHRLPGVRAELLSRAGRRHEARHQLGVAIGLCANEAELRLLRERLADLAT